MVNQMDDERLESGEALDRVIDRVARDMAQTGGRVDVRRAVRARIAAPRPARSVRWLWATAGVIGSLAWLWVSWPAERSTPSRSPAREVRSLAVNPPAPVVSSGPALASPAVAPASSGPGARRAVTRAGTEAAVIPADAPHIDPLRIEPLQAEGVVVDRPEIVPLDIEPVRLDPVLLE